MCVSSACGDFSGRMGYASSWRTYRAEEWKAIRSIMTYPFQNEEYLFCILMPCTDMSMIADICLTRRNRVTADDLSMIRTTSVNVVKILENRLQYVPSTFFSTNFGWMTFYHRARRIKDRSDYVDYLYPSAV